MLKAYCGKYHGLGQNKLHTNLSSPLCEMFSSLIVLGFVILFSLLLTKVKYPRRHECVPKSMATGLDRFQVKYQLPGQYICQKLTQPHCSIEWQAWCRAHFFILPVIPSLLLSPSLWFRTWRPPGAARA